MNNLITKKFMTKTNSRLIILYSHLAMQRTISQILCGYKQRQSKHTFVKPVDVDGSMTRYFRIIKEIAHNGPMSKVEVLATIGMRTDCPGFYSSVFGGLNACGILDYNHKTRLWFVGPNYYNYMYSVNNFLVLL